MHSLLDLPEVREVFSWWVGGSHFSLPPWKEQSSAVSLTFPVVLLINICNFDVLEAECRKIKTHTCWLLWRVRTGCFPHVVCGIASQGCSVLGQCLALPWELSRQELGRKQHGCVLGRSRTWGLGGMESIPGFRVMSRHDRTWRAACAGCCWSAAASVLQSHSSG